MTILPPICTVPYSLLVKKFPAVVFRARPAQNGRTFTARDHCRARAFCLRRVLGADR